MINLIIKLMYSTIISFEMIRTDVHRYYGSTDFKTFSRALRIPGCEFMLYFRLCNMYSKYSLIGIISRVMNERLTFKYGFQIPRATKVGKGLRISHFGALVINYDAIIGENCYVSHNVTIGKVSHGHKQGSPIIGNRVWMGPGAVIIGRINIGDNVLIAANSFVTEDVPSNSIVIGNPARIIPNENATLNYINNIS